MNLYHPSLQTRLTLLVLATVHLFGLIAGYASGKNALAEADEIFDAQLAQYAQNLLVVASHAKRGMDPEYNENRLPYTHEYQGTLIFQVWRNTSSSPPQLLLRSDNTAGITFAQIPLPGYSDGEWRGEHWRYFRQYDDQTGLDVLVGQNDKARNEMEHKVSWHSLASFLLGLPILGLLVIYAIRLGLRPLLNLTESLEQLSPSQLRPLAIQGLPKEIMPVLDALNILLQRITKVMENERRFTADASHELRTPLAALQAQVQAAKLTTNETERNESLTKALLSTERMAHLIGQLLTLSRLDELSTPLNFETINFATLIQESFAKLGNKALVKNIEISFSEESCAALSGSSEMLKIMLRNLLSNAIRYTPQNGRVEALLRLKDNQTELEIADSGFGVEETQLAQLGQRFNRLNSNTAEGVGLGLSIVQRIAEIHHAKLVFGRSDSLGGLSVIVCFPLHEVTSDEQGSGLQ